MSTQSINADPVTGPSQVAIASRLECRSYCTGLRSGWVCAGGELDLETAPELELVVRRAERRTLLMVIDLRGIGFMDCCGVHLLIDAARRARRNGRRLVVIVNHRSQAHRLMTFTQLDRLLDILDSPAAVDNLAADAPAPLREAIAT